MNVEIGVSRVHFPVTSLGPGLRLGIWFQGCSIRCPGCISMDTWDESQTKTTVAELLDSVDLYLSRAQGITISGGEPFDQPAALITLLKALRERAGPEVDVLVYSGYPRPHLEDTLQQVSGCIDALMADPYERETPQTLALRGSDNQRFHILTPLGQRRLAEYQRSRTAEDDRLDFQHDGQGGIWLAGIPRRGDLERLKRAVGSQGGQLVSSEQWMGECV